ncbi:hypothetical protein [Acetonema longum]|uniref:Uncharacterized protein n=1 Tax=Acetonema longum DSM 6540 TaxID=1009370 RepID=F7NEV3_9FIRM|nr:hypothetical protein [Acetonema longum]EGO65514.1 hypothetical protein ALO_02851 [Acetonema longum DSM 6540]
MKVFVWRHNRKYHSYSMINEPNVHQAMYNDAVLAVAADSLDEAYEMIERRSEGWVVEELKRLEPKIFDLTCPAVVFQDVRGS